MWSIDKEFHFEMGHRVHAQKLDRPDLSIVTECSCKHLHGHSYTVKVFLTSGKLDNSGMVTDFKNISFMKKFLDEVLDHKFMIDVNDPLFNAITGVKLVPGEMWEDFTNLGEELGRRNQTPAGLSELLDSFVLVNWVPTSENICKHLKEYAQRRLNDVATVSAVELWETKKSHCRYE